MKKLFSVFVIASISAGAAFADADAAILERQAAMKAVGKAAKAKDLAAVSAAAVKAKAAFAVSTAGEGSVETKALDIIWGADAAGFNKLMDELINASASGDQAAFGTCKACHKGYRS